MFINENYLLQSELAKNLYKEIKDLPIIDYHNHLSPKEIYENEPYQDITDIWLKHDHYKWRLMRVSGIDERYISGDAKNKEKFLMFVKALESAYLNPLYHWSHMELKDYFGINEILTSDNAEKIYMQANDYLLKHTLGPRELLLKKNVETLCTTDDLNDDLRYHHLINDDDEFKINVLPTFRPDSIFRFNEDSFLEVIKLLEKNTQTTITGMTTLATALCKRLDYFQKSGAIVSDHGLTYIRYLPVTKSEASIILKKLLMRKTISKDEGDQLTVYLLKFFIKEYGIRKITCQLHLGALRNTNKKMFNELGKDSGYDSISDHSYVNDLNSLFSDINRHSELPKTIIYNLHAKDNQAIASLCGNFSESFPGKIQLGAAWWFHDNMHGILSQMKTFSEYLNISTMIGMLTDSRSFLSFVRHDYYRRILADFVAQNVKKGLIPNDMMRLVELVKGIAYFNSKSYFEL